MNQPLQPMSTVNVTPSASTTQAGGHSGEEKGVAFRELLDSPQNPAQSEKTTGQDAGEIQDLQTPSGPVLPADAEQSSFTAKQPTAQKTGTRELAKSQWAVATVAGMEMTDTMYPVQLPRSQQNARPVQTDGNQESGAVLAESLIKLSLTKPGKFAHTSDQELGVGDGNSPLQQLLHTGMAVFNGHSATVAEAAPLPAGDVSRNLQNTDLDPSIARFGLPFTDGNGSGDGRKHALVDGLKLSSDQLLQVNGSRLDAAALASVTEALTEPARAASSARIHIPVGQPGWGGAIAEQVVWFVSQHVSAANLRLNPQHLGPLEMHVRMEGDQANVAFMSHSPAVREALETAIPRLREMLGENGLSLASVNVSQQDLSQQRDPGLAGSGYSNHAPLSMPAHAEDEMLQDEQRVTRTLLGLVDYYV
jgi:flagellar hook-length control protein FliK